MNQQTITLKLSNQHASSLFEKLIKLGYIEQDNSNEYILWRVYKEGINAIFYTSGKLVVQGKGDLSFFEESVNIDVRGNEKTSKDSFKSHIGSDEVGKGDYFGPLVVCSAYLDEHTYKVVSQLGIADSKTISDKKILSMYSKIKDIVVYESTILHPKQYNEENKKIGNVSIVLGNLHKETVSKLISKLEDKKYDVVIDQFSANKGRLTSIFKDMNINLIQFHKGESDVAVACASVIARAIFLLEYEKMNEKYDTVFPKGASNVIEFAKEFVKKNGVEQLQKVAKISFKTTQSVL